MYKRSVVGCMLMCVGFWCVGCASLGRGSVSGMERPRDGIVHIFYANSDTPETRKPSGTGFVVDGRGIIATAAHVVERDGFLDVKFVRPDGSEALYVPARVVTLDRERDVALLKVDVLESNRTRVQSVVSAQGDVRVGDAITVYGFPESEVVGVEMRRSSGMISSKRSNPLDRQDHTTRMLELEAKIEPGNSGSPVYNGEGEVLGVVSSRWKTTDSYALAVPIAVVWELIEERFATDWSAGREEMSANPEEVLELLTEGESLVRGMEGVFPLGSEGERVLEGLRFSLGRVQDALKKSQSLRNEGADVAAWRQIQVATYEANARRQDLAFLRSLSSALRATSLPRSP